MMTLLVIVVLLVTIVPSMQGFDPDKDYHGPFNLTTCPYGESLSYVKSDNYDYSHNRGYDIGCAPLPGSENRCCEWTGDVNWNDLDQPLDFVCPNDGFIAGLKYLEEDRSFQFYCCIISVGPSMQRFVNEYDRPFNFKCRYLESLSYVKSVNNDRYRDRLYDLRCTPVPHSTASSVSQSCKWTYYVNEYDKPVDFECPQYDGFLAGMSSVHHNYHEDRMFRFYCCEIFGRDYPRIDKDNCTTTPWLNKFDEDLIFKVPHNHVIIGTSSYHDNHYEDRRTKYTVCPLVIHIDK